MLRRVDFHNDIASPRRPHARELIGRTEERGKTRAVHRVGGAVAMLAGTTVVAERGGAKAVALTIAVGSPTWWCCKFITGRVNKEEPSLTSIVLIIKAGDRPYKPDGASNGRTKYICFASLQY